jgi:hypothetical protein
MEMHTAGLQTIEKNAQAHSSIKNNNTNNNNGGSGGGFFYLKAGGVKVEKKGGERYSCAARFHSNKPKT